MLASRSETDGIPTGMLLPAPSKTRSFFMRVIQVMQFMFVSRWTGFAEEPTYAGHAPFGRRTLHLRQIALIELGERLHWIDRRSPNRLLLGRRLRPKIRQRRLVGEILPERIVEDDTR